MGIRKSQVRKIKEARAAYHAAGEGPRTEQARKAMARADAAYQRVVDNASQEEWDAATR